MWAGTYTSVITDRLSSVTRFGRIGESLTTAPQGFFNEDGEAIGFGGRDPFSIGQRNEHASYITGTGGGGFFTTVIRSYVLDQAFSYFVPQLFGGEHTFKAGGGYSWNNMDPRSTLDSGTFQFRGDAGYNPADPLTHPFQFNVVVGPEDDYGYAVVSKDQRRYLFLEDKWSLTSTLTLNLGVRWDNHEQTPNHNDAIAPRAGFAWDAGGNGRTVVRGGVGKFFAYVPVVHDLTLKQSGVKTLFPSISINSAHPLAPVVLVPDMITDTAGNPGVARLSPAAQAALNQLRDAVVAGTAFNANPRVDSPDRRMPHMWSWSLGFSQEIISNMALSVDYVANASRDQLGVIDINEPVNGVRPGVAVFDPDGTMIPRRGARRELPARAAVADQSGLRRRLQVAAGVAGAADGQPLERANRLHAAAVRLRGHRQPRRPPGVARQRPPRRLRRVHRPTAPTCWRPAAPGTRGGR